MSQQDQEISGPGLNWSWHSPVIVDAGMGRTVYAVRIPYTDSVHVEVLWCDAAQNIDHAARYRLPFPSAKISHAAAVPGGLLIAGSRSGNPYGRLWVMRLDSLGGFQWLQEVKDLVPWSLAEVEAFLVEDQMFTIYSRAGLSSYSVQGNIATGFDLSSSSMISLPNGTFHSWTYGSSWGRATPVLLGPTKHLWAGNASWSGDPLERDVMLFEIDSAGVQLLRCYDLGATNNGLNERLEHPRALLHLADSNFLIVGFYVQLDGSFYEGSGYAFVLKVDPLGDVIWCRGYGSATEHVTFAGITELPSGRFLVGGSVEGEASIFQLDTEGEILARNEWGGETLHQRKAYPSGAWMGFDGQQYYVDTLMNACNSTSASIPVSYPIVPVVTNLSGTVAPATFDTLWYGVEERQPQLYWQPACQSAGMTGVTTDGDQVLAYPDPTDGLLYLEGEQVRTGMPVVVRDLMGREVLRTRYHGVLDLSGLSPGGYLVELPELQRRVRVVKR